MSARRYGDLFIHGIGQRSGTNYLARILKCHADVSPSPREIWEFPHLRFSDPLIGYASRMADAPHVHALERDELVAYLGDALLAYAAEGLPPGRRLMMKQPSVEKIDRFFQFFPRSFLLLLVRDGRDVACSALKTDFASPLGFAWRSPGTWRFAFRHPLRELARRWRDSSRAIHSFVESIEDTERATRVRTVRFEDLVRDGSSEVMAILDFVGLPEDRFDWARFDELDVRGSSFVGNREGGLDWSGASVKRFEPIGRWREWNDRERSLYRAVAGEELARWGYLDPGETP